MPLGYEVFDGNRADVTTALEDVVKFIEELPWKKRILGLGDGSGHGVGAERRIPQGGWPQIYSWSIASELEARFEEATAGRRLEGDSARAWKSKLCPTDAGDEVFILCRSADRRTKEAAMHELFEKRIDEGLAKLKEACTKSKKKSGTIERAVGALMKSNSRSARLYDVKVAERDGGGCDIKWEKIEAHRQWSQLSEGCYLLRSNITDWTPEELWKAYIQLTEAEEAFRIQKSDLQLRPIHHQKRERVQAHILVCFLAYVLWKTFAQLCKRVRDSETSPELCSTNCPTFKWSMCS